jgi:phage host-nuclease inhibitor protein Gam
VSTFLANPLGLADILTANATKAISQLRESLEALRVENGNLLSQLHKCKEAHAAYQVQESQIARMQEQLQQESETNRKRTATIERLQKQIDAHKASASKTERKQEHHDVEQTKTDALQEQSKIAQTLIDELREKQRLHKEMTDKLQNSQEATIHELRKWCNGYEPIVARLQKQCEAYEARIPELQKKCEAHQSCSTMIEALRRECQEHLREAGDLRAQLSKPNLHRRCTENLASLKKQLASRQEKNQPTSRVVLREAVPNPAAIPMEDDPVRAENLLLKSTIKQVDENITSLCALMVNVMGFLKRTEERKAAYSRMGRVIMSLGRGDIIRLPANDPNAPATLASFVREFVVSYDLAYMQCMRLGDIIQAEREVIRQASGAMKELQADHDELQGTCIAVLEKATRERTQAKARETKLLDDIRQSEELIFGYEEVIRRLMHQS